MFSAIFEIETNSESGKFFVTQTYHLKKMSHSGFGDYLKQQQPQLSLLPKYSDCSLNADLTCLPRADGARVPEEVRV